MLPVTIVVEGITEVIGIPLLLKRLAEAQIEGFTDTDSLLGLSHFLDGRGDNFERLCRLAKSQGCKPIIFVDGDKIQRLAQLHLDERHPDVPVLHLEDRKEFEQIVPVEIYFQALEKVIQKDDLHENYTKWDAKDTHHEKLAFSKRVDRWLQDTYPEMDLDKPEVMRKAIEIADLDTIDVTLFRELLARIKTLLD